MAIDPLASPRYAKITLRTDCPRCGAHLPVNAPVEAVGCDECGHELTLDPELLKDVLTRFEDDFPDEVRQTRIAGDQTWKVVALPFAAPPCPACDATLTEVDETGAVCPGCGTSCTIAAPPGFLRGKAARVIVPLAGPVDSAAATPIALNCPGCGAGLSINAQNPRLTTCQHCSSQVHLPELVWRRFHPKRTVMPWIARFEGQSRAAKESERQQKKLVQRMKQKARDEERERADAAAKAIADAEKAKAAAEKAEQDQRWALFTSPLSVLSLLLALSAMGAMFSGVVVDVWHTATPAWRISKQLGIAADLFPIAMAGWAIAMWFVSVVFACIRAREGVGAFVWSAIMLGLSHIPFVGWLLGLYFAWEHLRDREPTVESDRKLPFLTGTGLSLIYGTLPLYDFVVFAFLVE